jgi:hypothetical protein
MKVKQAQTNESLFKWMEQYPDIDDPEWNNLIVHEK